MVFHCFWGVKRLLCGEPPCPYTIGDFLVIHGALLDIAGVLYEGDAAVPGAVEAVARLRNADIPVRFLTNSTRRPKRVIVEKGPSPNAGCIAAHRIR